MKRVAKEGSVRLALRSLVAMLAASIALTACGAPSGNAGSLYEPALAREVTRAERWRLDLELMNEVVMREHGNRRFGSLEARARWAENLARRDPVADLVQQIVDFRKGKMRDNEQAFGKLAALGRHGDVSARCFAAFLYGNHRPEVTEGWRVGYEEVMRQGLLEKDSGHPVCLGLEASLYMTGSLGYPEDRERARKMRIPAALAGSYGAQMTLARYHLEGALRFEPRHLALDFCWRRVADSFWQHAGYSSRCLSQGQVMNSDLRMVDAPSAVRVIGAEWCVAEKKVTAQTCVDLEGQLDKVDGAGTRGQNPVGLRRAAEAEGEGMPCG